MSPLKHKYAYFADPENFSTWSDHAQECHICGEERPGFEGPFYGEDEIEFLCEECLQGGAIVEFGATTNDGDMESLREQIADSNTGIADDQVAKEVERKFATLTEHTPPMATHAPLLWPAHCGDFCVYVKEAGRADLAQIAPGGDTLSFFLQHFLQSDDRQDPQKIHDKMRPESLENNHISHSPAVYLFKCNKCNEHFLLSDETDDDRQR